ncbi:MAG TPA: RidA family protein [Longimicrobiales bacterium]|nr:RidA family protein [Longimicrobiales bacterium]
MPGARSSRPAAFLFVCVAASACSIEPRTDRPVLPADTTSQSEFLRPWGDSVPPAGVRSGDLVWVWRMAGTVPGAAPERLVEGGAAAETRQAAANVLAVLEEAGGSLEDLAQCSLFVTDGADLEAARAAYVEALGIPPTRVALASDGLALGARVELECTAVLSEGA